VELGSALVGHKERNEDMKMAKASQADLDMAMDLAAMLDTLGHRHCPAMPTVIARNDGDEQFDIDDAEQCGRALRALLETADRGSLFRVVWGAVVMLDPRNKLVDPGADTIERHPDGIANTKDAERYRWLRAHGDNHCTEKDGYGGQTLKMGDCLDVAVDAAMAPRPAVGAA
jgi:hypothetical protein